MSGTRLVWLAASIGFTAAGCAPLPEIDTGVCGNAVIESGETCDRFAVGDTPCRPPGEAQACHLDCSPRADGTPPACPAGWGCAADGVCREASGAYRALADQVAGSAHSLLSADFDGDGRGDVVSLGTRGVLGTTKFRVHYFDREGALAATWSSPRAVASLVAADVSGDARADAVFAEGRMGVLLGQEDRSLISETYPTYFLPNATTLIAGGLYSDAVGDSAPLLVFAEQDDVFTLYRPDSVSGRLLSITEFRGSIEQLAGELALGDVFEDDARYPCLDMGMALQGAHELALYSACERDPATGAVLWRQTAEVTTVALEPEAAIDRGPLLADVDGDGHVDVLVGSEGRLHVAFGDGERLTAARPLLAEVDGVPDVPVEMPIAAGDFTGDGAADLVYPRGFMRSDQEPGDLGPSYRSAFNRVGGSWSEAQVVDLNGNGMADVIAASNTNLDIDFYNGTGTSRPAAFVVPTSRPVEHLAVGDLDGDLIADLAFTLVGDPSEPLEVAVAFGRSAGPPAPGVVVARAPGIVQIGTSFYGSASGIGELFIVFEQVDDVDGPGSALAWLGAGGDRSLMCLIELTTFAEDGSINGAPAFAVATGAFTAPDRVDALLLGADLSGDDLGMWLLPDLHSQRGRPQHLGWPFDPRLQPLTGFSGSPDDDSYVEMLMSVGDIDADGLDEVVVAAPDQRGERCLLSSARVTAAGGYELAAGEPVVLDTACSRAGQLALQDLDADDAPDIVLLAGAASGPHPLYVLWNDGAGGFSTDAVTQVQLEDEPQAFTLLRPSAAANSLLAYVSETQVYLLQAAGRARRFEDSLVQVELQLEHGTGITATDVDGDGIVDIVVADAGDIRVLRAELVP